MQKETINHFHFADTKPSHWKQGDNRSTERRHEGTELRQSKMVKTSCCAATTRILGEQPGGGSHCVYRTIVALAEAQELNYSFLSPFGEIQEQDLILRHFTVIGKRNFKSTMSTPICTVAEATSTVENLASGLCC